MEDLKTETTDEILEKSKAKLADAFDRLEKIFEGKFKTPSEGANNPDEIVGLKNKVAELEGANSQLFSEHAEIYEKFHKAKKLNNEVVENLNLSIDAIEQIINNKDGNSRSKNS